MKLISGADTKLRPNYQKQAYIAILENGRVVSVPFSVLEEKWDDGTPIYREEDKKEVLSDAMAWVDLGY